MMTFFFIYLFLGILVSSFGQYCIYMATNKTYFSGWLLDVILWPIALIVMIRIVTK